MKKLMLMLMVAAISAPLYAVGGITFTATDADGVCTVTFAATDPCIPPVAMALNIKVDGSDPLDAITEVTDIDSFFDIYMDFAYDDPCAYTYGAGHPIADPCAAGSVLLSLSGMNFCISMGGLGGTSEPLYPAPPSGTAFVLHADNAVPDPCDLVTPEVTGTISINALRGGVVGTDTEAMTTNLSIPFTINVSGDCYTNSDAQAWIDRGKPPCWCALADGGSDYQCKGDTDGVSEGRGDNTKWVVLADLTVFNNAWQKSVTDPDWVANAGTYICADFAHDSEGRGGNVKYVTLNDLTIFNTGWQKPVTDTYFTTNPCFPR